MPDDTESKGVIHATKRCPECLNYVPLRTKICPGCKTKLGDVQKHGMAKRKTDWMAYGGFFVAFVALAIYIWWAFL